MNKNETLVVSPDQMRSALHLKGKFGLWVANKLLRLLDIDRVNDIQSRHADLTGPAFAEMVLKEVGVQYAVPEEDLKNIPAEGGFILNFKYLRR